jgi:hypothetical protein
MLDKLNLKITYKLLTKLASVLKTNSLKTSIILTNSHIFFDLINYIFITNKQLPFLENKRVKAIRSD